MSTADASESDRTFAIAHPVATDEWRSTVSSRTRLAAFALGAAGVFFVLYPAVRPWHDETTVQGATTSMSSNAWVAAHFFAMIGFVLLPVGLLGVWGALRATRHEALALSAAITSWIGAGLTLPYYGAEDFGLHVIASKHASGLLDLIDTVRYQPVAITIFGLGLVLLAVGAVLAAVAIWRTDVLTRYGAVVYAAAFVLFLPQFYAPVAVRIAHGFLTGIGLVWLAFSLWRSKPAQS
jgi:hypothetical protein